MKNFAANSPKITNVWNTAMSSMASALGGELRMAGGAVRDILNNQRPNDYDFCTPYLPEEVMTKMRAYFGSKIEIIPTGLNHGTITIRFPESNQQFEITTLRHDMETDGRHAMVAFGADWHEDAARRDFTINAMMLDHHGNIYDWFDGMTDLNNGRVQFVGDADKRIREDYLRIFRWFRFAARFGTTSDREMMDTMRANAEGLNQISPERIWAETKKFIMNPYTDRVLFLLDKMHETGVSEFSRLFTTAEVKQLQYTKNVRKLSEFIYRYQTPETRLGYLWDIASRFRPIEGTLTDLIRTNAMQFRMSAPERDRMLFVNTVPMGYTRKEAEWDILNRVPKAWAAEAYRVQDLPGRSASEIMDWVVPVFPVSGKDLIESGMKPGPEMGKALDRMKRTWFDTGYQWDKMDLIKYGVNWK